MKISIIVPVYNAEAYVAECIESVLEQDYSDFELILVDDGSSDESLKVLRGFASRDKRVRVMAQENQGQTAARLCGLKASKGEYVWFVDADDKIFDGSLARIVSELSESSADVVCFDYFYMKDGKLAKRFMDSSFAGVYSGKRLVKFYEKMIYSGRFFYFGVPAAMWNKVFRRELALANMENVDLRIRVHEDGLTSYGALLAAEKIAVLREHLYVYRADNASTTRGYRDRSENMKLVISSLREISARFAAKSDIAAQIDYYALYQVWGMSVDLWVYKGIEGWFKKREYVAGLLRIPEVAEIRPRVSAAGMSFLNRGFVAGFKRGIPGLMLVFAWLIAAKKYWRGILGWFLGVIPLMLAKIRLTFGGMCDIIDRDSLRVAGFLLPGEFLRREHVDIFSVFYFLTNRLMRTIFDAEEFEEFGTNVADKGRKLQMIVRIWDWEKGDHKSTFHPGSRKLKLEIPARTAIWAVIPFLVAVKDVSEKKTPGELLIEIGMKPMFVGKWKRFKRIIRLFVFIKGEPVEIKDEFLMIKLGSNERIGVLRWFILYENYYINLIGGGFQEPTRTNYHAKPFRTDSYRAIRIKIWVDQIFETYERLTALYLYKKKVESKPGFGRWALKVTLIWYREAKKFFNFWSIEDERREYDFHDYGENEDDDES